MPYIPASKREYWDKQLLFDTEDPELTHPGTLNYIITRVVQHFVNSRGGEWDDRNLNSIYGALICCLLELHRRKGKRTSYTSTVFWDESQGKSYTLFNDSIGSILRQSFTLCELDLNPLLRFYSSVVSPYEDLKIKENGDVYD